jgi:hypothetical protein
VTTVDVLAEHAYELAFRACVGRRVAVLGDGPIPAGGDVELVGTEAIDEGEDDAFGAIVVVRGRGDSAPAEEVLEQVRPFAERGVPVVVSLPCGPERDGGDAREALESLAGKSGDVAIVELRTASGSLIGPVGHEEAAIALAGEPAGDPEAMIAFANLDPSSLPPESRVRLAPAPRRSLAALEHSVGALERANRSLARPAASKRTSAAASEIHRSTQLERRLLHLHRESPWVTQPIRIARGLARRLRAVRERLSR